MKKEFLIQHPPTPLARARFTRRTGKFYDSQRKIKEFYGWELKRQHGIDRLFRGPLEVYMEFGIKTLFKKQWSTYHTCRPDLSNLVKFVEDAALGILYGDDAIISDLVARKRYVEKPYVLLGVTEIEEA